MANILSGKQVAQAINEKNKVLTTKLLEKNIIPTLATFRVGENSSDISYEKSATKKCKEIGVDVINNVFDENESEEEFYKALDDANNNPNIHGILVFRPLPSRFNDDKLRNFINPNKDVDGCSDSSLAGIFANKDLGFAPCTAQAAMEILDYYNIDVKSKNIVVLGRSLVIGKPVSMMLLNKNATVTICHTKTKDVKSITKNADIIIAATGQMESLNKEYFSNNQTVIDVGISYNEIKQKLCGDVLFEEVEPIVENITPVPGGVGSVTTSILISHIINACIKQN